MAASSIPERYARHILRDLEAFAAQRDAWDESLDPREDVTALAAFLAFCASSLTKNGAPDEQQIPDEFLQTRNLFVRAGLDALAGRLACTDDWYQIGIHPTNFPEPQSELYRRISALAERLLIAGDIDNFFYMNKAPGMRLRFQAASTGRSLELRAILDAEVARWRSDRLIDDVEPGIYEPESLLFGGVRSMPFVHALFTVDSLIWLDYHASRLPAGQAFTPAWLTSLALLRTLFAGLQIIGWEDVGVWDLVRAKAGRRLGDDKDTISVYTAVAQEIRDVWSRRDQIKKSLNPAAKTIVARHDQALHAGAAQWRTGYFSQPNACIGPRAAAAFFVIFHWNRAGLNPTEQALLAESLAEREI